MRPFCFVAAAPLRQILPAPNSFLAQSGIAAIFLEGFPGPPLSPLDLRHKKSKAYFTLALSGQYFIHQFGSYSVFSA